MVFFSTIILYNLVNKDYKVCTEIFPVLIENAQKTGKSDSTVALNACKVLTAIAKDACVPAEGYLIEALPAVLKAVASKEKTVREAATETCQTIMKSMSSFSVGQTLPALFAASKIEENWQSRALALKTIASFGDGAPEQLGYGLPLVVPEVTNHMTDLKKEVKQVYYMYIYIYSFYISSTPFHSLFVL